jgi:3-oxoacyl-[acyl-carrier-protein] synthase III
MPYPAPTATQIAGVGSYVPERVLTNRDLERMVDTSDAWIRERTGIRERRLAAEGETASDMALKAAQRALEHARLSPADLDMIVMGTVTGDMPWPACAAFLQHKLGAKDIPAFDVSAACAGFLYSLAIGDQFIRSGTMKNVLIVGVELLSRIIDWQDRSTCILFGDGAGAAVLTRSETPERGVRAVHLHTDGSLASSLCQPAGGTSMPITPELIERRQHKVFMNGPDIFKAAVKNLTSASTAALDSAGLSPSQVDWVVPHQANLRIISQVASRLNVPMERYVLNLERYGNTSSASIPIALDEGIKDGRIKPGDNVLMCALGGGVSWASALVTM